MAVLIPADAGSVDETLETLRRARGLDRLPTAEIDATVARARRARGPRRG